MNKDVVQFLRKKDFRFVRNIGQGGTGKTILLKDETIDEVFVCKKYAPYYESDVDQYYSNFLTEIKILHTLFHVNIVRVFNYYLYPDKKTGYILMDYIKGATISDFIRANPDRIDDVFNQLIDGFRYLEENEILHRDIRPENILVNDSGILKVIDFGFGKQILFNDDFDKSISLNWRYPVPKEFSNKIYSKSTEVYFIGKLIEEIIHENEIENFGYPVLLAKMVIKDPEKRTQSFLAAQREMLSQQTNLLEFTDHDKTRYKEFAGAVDILTTQIYSDATYVSDIDKITKALEDILQHSSLETFIQNPQKVVSAFIKGGYFYKKNVDFPVYYLKHFLELLKQYSVERKKVVLNNLWQRFDKKPRFQPSQDDLPF